jgi:hypothetical protein
MAKPLLHIRPSLGQVVQILDRSPVAILGKQHNEQMGLARLSPFRNATQTLGSMSA